MRRGMSRLAAGFLVLFALLLGIGGGCLIGDQMAPRRGDAWGSLAWSMNGGLIGAGLGLAVALGIIHFRRWRG